MKINNKINNKIINNNYTDQYNAFIIIVGVVIYCIICWISMYYSKDLHKYPLPILTMQSKQTLFHANIMVSEYNKHLSTCTVHVNELLSVIIIL